VDRRALVLTALGIAVALLVAFVVVESRGDAPLVPFDIFATRTLRYANLATLFLLGTVVTVFFFASLFMQHGHGAALAGKAGARWPAVGRRRRRAR
jgi:MFS family permease